MTKYLQLLIRSGCGYNFHTSAEREVVRQIKEQVTYVAYDPKKEEEDFTEAGNLVKVLPHSFFVFFSPNTPYFSSLHFSTVIFPTKESSWEGNEF